MENSINELIFSRSVVEFVTVAKEYCAYIENVSDYKRKSFVRVMSSLLPLLYYKASLLPQTEPIYEEGNIKHVTEEYYIALNLRIKDLLGEHDAFPEVFDSRISEIDEQFSASIAEYLSDIYQDLKDFTMLYQKGQVEEMNDALWECTLNFQEFWGIRLANAIRAIHVLQHSGIDIEKDEEENTIPEKDIDTSQWIITKRQSDYREDE
jgi:hypothetical protein